jgi:hypothetical protein
MRITPAEPFLDGHDRYEPDRSYDVTDQQARYFVDQGWAAYGDPESRPPRASRAEAIDMQPDDSTQGQGS